MKSWKIARFADIDVYVHWSFALLLGWVALSSLSGGLIAMAFNLTLLVAVFTCVVMHEYGHALAARQFGFETRNITLLPIGGVANLAGIPRNPFQELWIAIAGPLVNVAIASVLFILYPGLLLSGGAAAPIMFTQLFYINVVLVLFNMVPAFPMDGGRVFRSVIAMFLPYVKATRIAVNVGKVMAVLLAVVGLFYWHNPMLILVAVFVILAGEGEARMVEQLDRQRALHATQFTGGNCQPFEPSAGLGVPPVGGTGTQGFVIIADNNGKVCVTLDSDFSKG